MKKRKTKASKSILGLMRDGTSRRRDWILPASSEGANTVEADSGATGAAGAQVLPTDPKLKIEPK